MYEDQAIMCELSITNRHKNPNEIQKIGYDVGINSHICLTTYILQPPFHMRS